VLSGPVNHTSCLPVTITAAALLPTYSPLVRNHSRALRQVTEPSISLLERYYAPTGVFNPCIIIAETLIANHKYTTQSSFNRPCRQITTVSQSRSCLPSARPRPDPLLPRCVTLVHAAPLASSSAPTGKQYQQPI
jgi:hypothetical protein